MARASCRSRRGLRTHPIVVRVVRRPLNHPAGHMKTVERRLTRGSGGILRVSRPDIWRRHGARLCAVYAPCASVNWNWLISSTSVTEVAQAGMKPMGNTSRGPAICSLKVAANNPSRWHSPRPTNLLATCVGAAIAIAQCQWRSQASSTPTASQSLDPSSSSIPEGRPDTLPQPSLRRSSRPTRPCEQSNGAISRIAWLRLRGP